MAIAKVSLVKNVSSHRRWEWVREHGMMVDGALLKGAELDEYVNEQVWRAGHPGKDTVVEVQVP